MLEHVRIKSVKSSCMAVFINNGQNYVGFAAFGVKLYRERGTKFCYSWRGERNCEVRDRGYICGRKKVSE